jgi:hypothetical protein
VKVASFDNLFFFLLIGVAALFQLLSKVVSKASKNSPDDTSTSSTPEKQPPPIRRTPPESDAERIRKFLEALGQPPSSTPPSPLLPRTDIPPRRLAPVQPPPVMPGAWRLSREQRRKSDVIRKDTPPPEQPTRIKKFASGPLPAAAVPSFEVTLPIAVEEQQIVKTAVEAYDAPTRAARKRADLKTDIAILLASQSGLREAMILREIFGPPRGLQADIGL